ncbi:MAG: restriction endonuclease [Candidatus Bathyarchaeota archaeon]|nr:MAG: restriction endonuclease [Candidatus Bathyarchaeota archaeon]
MNDALEEKEKSKKGGKFEVFFESLMQREKDFRFVFKHARSELGEIDYVYSHNLPEHHFWKIFPYICVECKNWEDDIGPREINHLKTLIDEKAPFSCCGVYITSSSYLPSAINAINFCRASDKIVIVPVEGKDLANLVEQGFIHFIQALCESKVFKKTG